MTCETCEGSGTIWVTVAFVLRNAVQTAPISWLYFQEVMVMAGSLNHIIGKDGQFTMELIDNLGDAYEALEECYALIIELSGGDMQKVSAACLKYKFPNPYKSERFSDDPMPATMKI